MNPVLIYLRPLHQITKQRVDIRVADSPTADAYGTGGYAWEPAITSRPKLSIELMSPDMDGKVQAGTASFEISLAEIFKYDGTLLYWGGASVVIHTTGVLEGPSAVPDFWGYVTSAKINYETQKLQVTATVSTALIDRDMLTLSFTGGGGINGDAASRGVLLPAGHGTVKNIQPVWFDRVRNIGMIDGYGNTLGIDWLGEGLNSLGAPLGPYDSYSALAAAIDNKSIPPGRWGYAISSAGYSLVGLGAPATGVITVHARFASGKIGSYMKRLLLTFAKVNPLRIDQPGFDALDQAVPQPIHDWRADQVNVKDLLEQLAQSCNATPLVSFQNQITVTRAVLGSPIATLDRSGSIAPRVLDWQTADTSPPYYQIKGRAARPASVLSTDQVNYVDTIIDRGLYDSTVVYRAGNLVWLGDKSSYLYTNSTADKGHDPPTSAPYNDAYWTQLTPPVIPGGSATFAYADGTPAEALKPAQAGADQTATHTADSIKSQGPGATAPGTDVLNGYVPTGANQLVLSSFARGLQGFRPGFRSTPTSALSNGTPAGTLTCSLNLTGYSGARNVAFGTFSDTLHSGDIFDLFWTPGPWGGDSLASGNGYTMQVKQNDRVYWRSLVARHRCDAQLYLLIFNKDGQLVEAPNVIGGRVDGGANGDPNNFDLVAGIYDIKNAGAALALLMWRMGGNGGGNPYVFFTEPAMGVLPSTQNTIPPYSAGPSDPYGDRTQENIAMGFQGQGALAGMNVVTPQYVSTPSVSALSPNLGQFDTTDGASGYRTIVNGKGLKIFAPNGNRVAQIGPD